MAAEGQNLSGHAVFRPRRARIIVYCCAGALFITLAALAVALPHGGQHSWGVGSRVALLLLAVALVLGLHRLASIRVEAAGDGVRVVNVFTSHQLEWAQIVGVRLSRDDPWLVLDLDDGAMLQAMGIAKSEGAAATADARAFAAMVEAHSVVPGHELGDPPPAPTP